MASDQDRFDTAYEAFCDLAEGLYDIDLTRYSRGVTSEDAPGVQLLNGQEKLQELVHLPRTWPLARLTIPLAGLSRQIDRLLEGYCFQILATNRDPEANNGKVIQTATHLTWILAEYLADTIAWLMQSILDHASKILFDNDTQPLLTPSFWILPLYRELLNSARRIRPSAASERARGCTGLVKLICKENKEQRGKRKFHAGTPHPNDRGGFTASWAPMVAEKLFGWSSHPRGSSYPQRGQPASEPPQTHSGAHPWHQHSHGAAGSSGAMEDADSTEVVYKIRQWSLPGATVVPALNVSSRVFWLELDDKALLDSYTVLQEGILCDVFSQKCSAAWQGARGERLIRLPSCCRAVKMRMTGSISCCRKRTYGPLLQPGVLSLRRSPNRSFVRSGAGCRPSICGWRSSCGGVCLLTECTPRPPLGSPKKNSMLCFFDRAARRSHTNPYEEKAYRGPAIKEVQAWWGQCKEWMSHFKGQSAPLVFDFKSLLKALSGKEAEAHSDVDAFMEHCAKRWQTREGTYQLKRRRLKPDVRDPPEDRSADVDMADI